MSSLVNNYNKIKDELQKINNSINSFNYIEYFKYEFNRIIKCAINNLNIESVFKILLYTFDYDFYILLTSDEKYKQYYNLQKISTNNMTILINDFIKHYCSFYKDNIIEIIKGSLSFEKYYVNDCRRKIKYINFNNYTNEKIINNLQNKKNKYNYLYHIFDDIRYIITTSFIDYKNYAYIIDAIFEYDIDDSIESMDVDDYVLNNTVYNYDSKLNHLKNSDNFDYFGFYDDLFWKDNNKNVILNTKKLNKIYDNRFYKLLN